MRSTIDSAGRVVIPKPLRIRLNLHGGEAVDIRERDGRIEIDVVATAMVLAETDLGPVAVPEVDLPPLTDEIVRAVVDRSRR